MVQVRTRPIAEAAHRGILNMYFNMHIMTGWPASNGRAEPAIEHWQARHQLRDGDTRFRRSQGLHLCVPDRDDEARFVIVGRVEDVIVAVV
jgi:hypothetical protein